MTDTDLWADLEEESRKPGPTMTITKAQYGVLLERRTDSLEAAWDETTSALPEGYSLMVGHTTECKSCSGWWATASKRLEEPPYYPHIISSEHDRPRGEHHDATPAAALRALTARVLRYTSLKPARTPPRGFGR